MIRDLLTPTHLKVYAALFVLVAVLMAATYAFNLTDASSPRAEIDHVEGRQLVESIKIENSWAYGLSGATVTITIDLDTTGDPWPTRAVVYSGDEEIVEVPFAVGQRVSERDTSNTLTAGNTYRVAIISGNTIVQVADVHLFENTSAPDVVVDADPTDGAYVD